MRSPQICYAKCLLFIIIPSTAALITCEDQTLVLVHALFRHGDRTPLQLSYPTDPYANLSYYPYDGGQLTNVGKVNAYGLGRLLRWRYRSFIEDIYRPGIVKAISTQTDRSQMTLQLVLAGLFPPVGNQVWNPHLRWQPIPYNHRPLHEDKMLGSVFRPIFYRELNKYYQSPEYQKSLHEDSKILQYISEHSGMRVDNYVDAALIYYMLHVQQENGLKLTEWAKKIMPHPMESLLIKSYISYTGNTKLSQMSSGYLLKKIIFDTNLKIIGNSTMERTKIILYSAHEYNVAALLLTLGIFKPVLPSYTACILVEIHELSGKFGIKIVYKNYADPETLKLPNCDEICPIEKFLDIINKYIPEDD